MKKIKEVAKFLVAIIGAALTAGTAFIPEDYAQWLGVILAALTGIATYAVPNKEPEVGEHAA